MTISPSTVQAIVTAANNAGVSPRLAIADAIVESGLHNSATNPAGSYGVFQLQQGGELNAIPGSLAQQIAAARNPAVNARVALSEFALVEQSHPGASPGTIAALAQRPASPGPYAAKVDAVYAQLGSVQGLSGSPSTTPTSWSTIAHDIERILAGAGTFAASGGNIAKTNHAANPTPGAGSSSSSSSGTGLGGAVERIGITLALVLGALALIVLGVSKLFPGSISTAMEAVP